MLSNDTDTFLSHEIHPLYIDWKIVLESGGLALVLQWVLYLIANYFTTEKFYDLGGSLGYLLAVWHSYPSSSTQRQFLVR
jgi:hypothetical protein